MVRLLFDKFSIELRYAYVFSTARQKLTFNHFKELFYRWYNIAQIKIKVEMGEFILDKALNTFSSFFSHKTTVQCYVLVNVVHACTMCACIALRPKRSSRFSSLVLDSIFGSLQYKYRLVDKFKVRGTVEPKPPCIYQLVNRSPFTYSLKRAAHIFLVYARLIGAVKRKSHFSKRTPWWKIHNLDEKLGGANAINFNGSI